VRVKRKFTTLTFVLSLLKEGEGALEGSEAGRKGKKDCRNRVSYSLTRLTSNDYTNDVLSLCLFRFSTFKSPPHLLRRERQIVNPHPYGIGDGVANR